MKKWTIDDSKELYNINGWGTSYFGVNDRGNVYVTPCKDGTQIDIREVMDELSLRDVQSPVLLRFPDILDNRIEKTWSCFNRAAQEYDYRGENYVVYPIKVNQIQPVVEEIISHGKKFNLGVEAGSKPELHAVIAVQCQSDSIIICNGYKDQGYIELALLAQKMGKRIFIVVEKLNELDIIAREAKKMGVRPNIGIRIKLASSGAGKWEESGGDASKFGLTSAELLEALELLDKKDMRDCLRLIHFHIGSQILEMGDFEGLCRRINELQDRLEAQGITVKNLNVGGGLGIAYDDPDGKPVPDFKKYFDTYAAGLRLREGQQMHFELGRAVVGQMGSLITKVLYVKHAQVKRFCIVDAGMSDLIRPALYGAHHEIQNLTSREPEEKYDVVGPICESSDVFGKDEMLPACRRGDLIALRSAGAYGEIMACQYNCRKLPKAYLM